MKCKLIIYTLFLADLLHAKSDIRSLPFWNYSFMHDFFIRRRSLAISILVPHFVQLQWETLFHRF